MAGAAAAAAAGLALSAGGDAPESNTPDEAETLRKWADEVELNSRGPESHPDKNFKKLHIHIGSVNHLPVDEESP